MANTISPQSKIIPLVERFILSFLLNIFLTPFIFVGIVFISVILFNIFRGNEALILTTFFSFPLWSDTLQDGQINIDEIFNIYWLIVFIVTLVIELFKFFFKIATHQAIIIPKKINLLPYPFITFLFFAAVLSCYLPWSAKGATDLLVVLIIFWFVSLISFSAYLFLKGVIPAIIRHIRITVFKQNPVPENTPDPTTPNIPPTTV